MFIPTDPQMAILWLCGKSKAQRQPTALSHTANEEVSDSNQTLDVAQDGLCVHNVHFSLMNHCGLGGPKISHTIFLNINVATNYSVQPWIVH